MKLLDRVIDTTIEILELESVEIDDVIDKWFDPEFDDGTSPDLYFENEENGFLLSILTESRVDKKKHILVRGPDEFIIDKEDGKIIVEYIARSAKPIEHVKRRYVFNNIEEYSKYLKEIKIKDIK